MKRTLWVYGSIYIAFIIGILLQKAIPFWLFAVCVIGLASWTITLPFVYSRWLVIETKRMYVPDSLRVWYTPEEYARCIQNMLNIPITGKYDLCTEKAIKNFQNCHGLVSDGIIGHKTWQALVKSSRRTSWA